MSRLLALALWCAHHAIFLALSAASIAGLTAVLMGQTPTLPILVLPFLAAYSVYMLDRLGDASGTDALATPDRAAAVRNAPWWRWVSLIGAMVTLVFLAGRHSVGALALTLGFPFSGIVYVLPVLPSRRVRRLKDIPFLKAFYVPACWCLVVWLTLHLLDLPLWHPTSAAILLLVFGRIFVGASVGDLRDHAADEQAGVRTLVGRLGMIGTNRLLTALNGLTCALLVIACKVGGCRSWRLACFRRCSAAGRS